MLKVSYFFTVDKKRKMINNMLYEKIVVDIVIKRRPLIKLSLNVNRYKNETL